LASKANKLLAADKPLNCKGQKAKACLGRVKHKQKQALTKYFHLI